LDSGVGSWAIGGSATILQVSGELQVTQTATNGRAVLAFPTTVGKLYEVSGDVRSVNGVSCGLGYSDSADGANTAWFSSLTASSVATKLRVLRVANQPTMYAVAGVNGGGTGVFAYDNISIREVAADRSYKAQGATIYGTLTKALTHSANQVVAYSGFSAVNYLREPYSADLDFGTGEWSVGAWVNTLQVPLGGNLLGYTEDFSNAVWTTKINPVYGVLDKDGGTKAVNVTSTSANQIVLRQGTVLGPIGTGVSIANSIYIKRRTGTGTISFISPSNAQIDVTSLVASGAGTYVRAITLNNNQQTNGYFLLMLGTSGDSIDVCFPQVEVGAVATTYKPALTTPLYMFGSVVDRGSSTGASIKISLNSLGQLTATAYDGTTTRTVTTTATYNTATWLKPEAVYTTDGTLAIRVNGVEVAATRGNPLLTLNNANAVLTIGNSYALDAPFPGKLALVKLSATVPTPEQSVWMYEQEKQLFRDNAKCVLPDAGALVDLAYDEATDKWIAASAANVSEWSGLVRTNVIAAPAGSYSKLASAGGVTLSGRTTTSPGVDVTIPAYNLREELIRRAEDAARLNANLATFDYVGGFTANSTNGDTAILSVAGLSYPSSYKGAKVTGSGIPADTVVAGVSGTTIYLSKAATATATGVTIAFTDFALPVGYKAKSVSVAGAAQQEGATKAFTRLFDGFKETVRFGAAPAYDAWVQIQATRSQA